MALLGLASLVATSKPGLAQVAPADVAKRLDIWDLPLGASARSLPRAFAEFACGTNGGPPARRLLGWTEFALCRSEPAGLYEVYFRYDDEAEYVALANDMETEAAQFSGTRVYGFPAIVSLLFDAAGTLRGQRIVSDPRVKHERGEAVALATFLQARLGTEAWDCTDLAATEGETPVFGRLIKRDCTLALADGRTATLQARLLRRLGQRGFDPRSGIATRDQYESMVRFELRLP